MKRLLKICTVLLLFLPGSSYGDTLSLSGNPSTLTINTATAGQQPNSFTDTSTTYSVTTLLVVRSINGKLNSNMPSNVTLQVGLAAPSGATSLGLVTMTTTAANLVTSIPILTLGSSNAVTYRLSATAAAAKVTAATKTLTLTVQ